MPINKDEFRAALGRFASGVTVVTTTDADGKMYGLTVSAFCSVSLEPPLILVCVEKTTGSHRAIKEGEFFAVNILRESQQYYSDRFASYLPDKFDNIEFEISDNGVPVLSNTLAGLECRLNDAHDGGDHTIFVGLVEKSHISIDKPLIYFHGNYHKLND